MEFKDIIVSTRLKDSEVKVKFNRNLTEDLASDHSRLLYSPPFRRLSKKAQVFSLESNASVRSRITHSLEVSDVGRLIAYGVTQKLIEDKTIDFDLQLPIIYAVENACLVHDVGNPPFGHFGEIAIKNWFEENWEECYQTAANLKKIKKDDPMKKLIEDFRQFDGNPQGLRILLRLQRDRDKFGLNLTYTTILSFIKYSRSTSEPKGSGLKKKAGYFQTEESVVKRIKSELKLDIDSRYPLAYIMEAADDIAYCISDIEDGIEKHIITERDFFEELQSEWVKIETTNKFPFGEIGESTENKFFKFKVSYTQDAVRKATDLFTSNLKEILLGKVKSLFPDNSLESKAFDCLKNVARKKLFRSPEAENSEIAGLQIVIGLLEKYKCLLKCSKDSFNLLLEARETPSVVFGKNLDVEWRLFNKLPKKHLLSYQDQIKEFSDLPEWYFRAHLITDYISGMTDTFALEQYQLLSGIKIIQER
jgi:dGTPase